MTRRFSGDIFYFSLFTKIMICHFVQRITVNLMTVHISIITTVICHHREYGSGLSVVEMATFPHYNNDEFSLYLKWRFFTNGNLCFVFLTKHDLQTIFVCRKFRGTEMLVWFGQSLHTETKTVLVAFRFIEILSKRFRLEK